MSDEKIEKKEKKEIEVIAGNGKDLNISTVYDHIKIDKNQETDTKKKNIVIPQGSSENEDKKND